MATTGQAAKSCTAKRTKQDKAQDVRRFPREALQTETTKARSAAGSGAPAEQLNSGGIEQLSRWRVAALPARAGIRSLASHHTRYWEEKTSSLSFCTSTSSPPFVFRWKKPRRKGFCCCSLLIHRDESWNNPLRDWPRLRQRLLERIFMWTVQIQEVLFSSSLSWWWAEDVALGGRV